MRQDAVGGDRGSMKYLELLSGCALIKNFGEKVGVWKGVGCGLIAAFGRECCSWFPLRLPEAG
ncbi:MAG: hypothetical protein CR217_04855 [Beijerinckiaceae bacterium]|nr:MAG: hypothetical protein CR217_04855 [Beijerinckiaceae bacterium]